MSLLSGVLLLVRACLGLLMLHHGFEKLADPAGFSEFVVAKYFPFLPFGPMLWTLLAAAAQVGGSVGFMLGIFTRPSALAISGTMVFAMAFHLMDTGLEGFPIAIVPAHNYQFETSALYLVGSIGLLAAGPGQLAISSIVKGRFPSRIAAWI